MKNNYKRDKNIIFVLMLLVTFYFVSRNGFAESIWFIKSKAERNSDGGVSAELQICSDNPLLESSDLGPLVYGREVPSKWNKNYHKEAFKLKQIESDMSRPTYIVNSRHSIRYEIKAIYNNILNDGRKSVSCAKIDLFLYGKREFDPLENDHDVAEKMNVKFPFEIIDKNVATNYWIQTDQLFDLQLLFDGEPLSNKKVTVFDNKTICGEYLTDDEGGVKIRLPFPKDNPFKHTRDVCHYRIVAEHEEGYTVYNTTLTMLVHPQRKNSNFVVGLYTLLGSLACGIVFVVFKRKRFVLK